MSDCWATKSSTNHDIQAGTITLAWEDERGEHSSPILPPDASRERCVARRITPANAEWVCGRVAGHEGCHVSIGELARTGALAD